MAEQLLHLFVLEGLWGPNNREKAGFRYVKKQKKFRLQFCI